MRIPYAVPVMVAVVAASLALPSVLLAQEPAPAAETTTATTVPGGTATPAPGYSVGPRARKSGGAVVIADFLFTPAVISVSAGDTVTWTNAGPSAHTATASGGQFDSGTLEPGESFSHTFPAPGTFSYFCSIHPDMVGTIQVSGPGGRGSDGGGSRPPVSGSGPSASPQSSTGTPASTTPTSTQSGTLSESAGVDSPTAAGTSSSLPTTGELALPLALAAAALLGAGVALRRGAGRATR